MIQIDVNPYLEITKPIPENQIGIEPGFQEYKDLFLLSECDFSRRRPEDSSTCSSMMTSPK